jgi:hypothetical protein
MERAWSGDGPSFAIDWGGQDWTLRTDADRPGLYHGDRGPILGLAGLAARRRSTPDALSGATLVRSERHLARVEATYTPEGWGETTVRAAWSPTGADGIDLEVEIFARTVGDLRAVEVLTVSGPTADEGTACFVLARDRHCAGLSYDGREGRLLDLHTLPLKAPGELRACYRSYQGDSFLAGERRTLLVMARPEDVSRHVEGEDGPTVFALFGHDLERGVVLRGRLRALWVNGSRGPDGPGVLPEFQDAYERFCAEPPPLTT